MLVVEGDQVDVILPPLLYSSFIPMTLPIINEARNFRLGVINGMLFTFAETLTDPTLVLVAFVSHLSPSALWLGLIAPMRDAGWFLPQLWASGYVQSLRRKIGMYRWWAGVRVIAWGAMTAAVYLIRDPNGLLLAFFVTFGVYSLASGLCGLPFLEIVGKTVPQPRRGVYFAWRVTLGSLTGLGGSALVRWLLNETSGPVAFPYNFGVLMGLGWVSATLALIAFCIIDEPEDVFTRPPAAFLTQLQRARHILAEDRNYQRFVILRVAMMFGGASTPFFAVYVQQRLGGELSMVGIYLGMFTIANLLATAFFGRYSVWYGYRRTMVNGALFGMLMTAGMLGLAGGAHWAGLTRPAAEWWLVVIFVLVGVKEAAVGVAAQSLLLDIAPQIDRSLYLGFTNSLLGVALLSTGLSGVVVEVIGFEALFALALLANGLGLYAVTRMRDMAPPHAPELEGQYPIGDAPSVP